MLRELLLRRHLRRQCTLGWNIGLESASAGADRNGDWKSAAPVADRHGDRQPTAANTSAEHRESAAARRDGNRHRQSTSAAAADVPGGDSDGRLDVHLGRPDVHL
jgi:hypothetical protein